MKYKFILITIQYAYAIFMITLIIQIEEKKRLKETVFYYIATDRMVPTLDFSVDQKARTEVMILVLEGHFFKINC